MSQKFARDLKFLLTKLAAESITIGEILQTTGERGISLIISLLVLPFLLPMPPGLSGLIGLVCFCLAIQMALGKKMPWLPKFVARFEFSRHQSQILLENLRRITVWLSKIARPRWQQITDRSYTKIINGLCIAWLSILLMSPIPFTNPPPAIAILLLTLSIVEADGLLMFLGYLLTVANTVFFAFIVYALWQAPQLLPEFIDGW